VGVHLGRELLERGGRDLLELVVGERERGRRQRGVEATGLAPRVDHAVAVTLGLAALTDRVPRVGGDRGVDGLAALVTAVALRGLPRRQAAQPQLGGGRILRGEVRVRDVEDRRGVVDDRAR